MNAPDALIVEKLSHRYAERVALNRVDLRVSAGELFAVLGPNGGGKTTLFRVLSTLIPPQSGDVFVAGHSAGTEFAQIRHRIGVVFQSPSLDGKLTVDENLAQQACLYGLSVGDMRTRRDEVLQRLGVESRRDDLVDTLSGGLQRRVDLAKALMHRPSILLMDEPTTGLDPGARIDLWRYFDLLRREHGTTLVLTTHLLEEADRADRIAILHEGQVVAEGRPAELRARLGGISISIEANDASEFCERLRHDWQVAATVVGREVRLVADGQTDWPARLMREFPDQIQSVKVGRPTLEDVFVDATGHQFWHSKATTEPTTRPRIDQHQPNR